ncbi:MAG: hypothetical protein KAW92_12010 [Candidatus Cloacimonetes bacterium]|nr:hypothetical protein [Candidatus Cloacimonadota bacterium]
MGTQQVLLIVLAVIIVGVAVAVGITMFGKQSTSTNREALKVDLATFAARAIAFWKTPAGMAGGGNGKPGFGASKPEALRTVCRWVGLGLDGKFENENGLYFYYYYHGSDNMIIRSWGNVKGQNPSYSHWATPPDRRGNVSCVLSVRPKQNPPFTISIEN